MVDEAQLEAQLAAIRDAFVADLPERMGRIRAGWEAVLREGWEGDAWRELHREVHSLAGAGATFGCDTLGKLAKALELHLKEAVDSGAVEDAALARAESMLKCLQQEIDVTCGAVPAEVEEDAAPSREAGAAPPTHEVAKRLIYVVQQGGERDDELHRQLAHFGCRVRVLDTPDALVDAVARRRPDGVLIDFTLQEQDVGPLRRAAELGRHEGALLPMLCLSHDKSLPARLLAVRAGCRGYLSRPLDASVLIDRLEQLGPHPGQEPYRVLVVEDDEELAAHFGTILDQAGFDTRVVSDPMQAIDVLGDFAAELILMDLYMPDCNGTELAAVIRQEDAYVGVPIIYLSGETDLGTQIEAISEGGDEFLTKPIKPALLVAAVRARAQRARILGSYLKRDGLSGLLNHSSTKEALEVEMARARRRGAPLAFAMIDLDHFKQVNDSHGHPVGDRVIKSLARLLSQRLRKTDVVGRFGGEEFAIILPDTPLEDARRVLDELRESFAALSHQAESGQFRVSFSCGVAEMADTTRPGELIRNADAALYQAKNQGRNRVIAAT